MKKKILLSILMITLIAIPAFSAFAPTYDRVGKGIYSSPALISKADEIVTFGFNTTLGSDIDGLKFMADPLKTLDKSAKYLAEYLSGKDYAFWAGNSELRAVFESFDANFPKFDLPPEVYISNVQTYFLGKFLSEEYGDDRRAYAVSKSLPLIEDAFPYDPSDILGGATLIGIKIYGGSVKDNFGWDWNVNIRYDGASSLLAKSGSILSVDARSNIGYAFVIKDKLSLGFSVQPMLRMETTIPNQNYIAARLSNDMISLFTEDFKFGTGLSLDLGASYDINDELTMVLDLRNMPSFRSYYDVALTDLASFNLDFKEDSNIYFMPPDVALSVLWNRDDFHLDIEISDIVSQIVWNDLVPERDFNFYGVPKIRFTYDIDEDFSLTSRLEYEMLALAIDYKGFTAEISTKLDRLGFGIALGYRF